MPITKIYGIRHHGSGSALSLKAALDAQQPEVVLIEGPPDANLQLHHVANPALEPPVALLIYDPKDLHQASYYPFAEFSPEWVAMQWATQHSIAVEFMDLPHNLSRNLPAEENVLKFNQKDTPYRADPLAYFAEQSGFTDSERWWETYFEHTQNTSEIFEDIIILMRHLRETLQPHEPLRERLREAYMRQTIRAAQKKYHNIAVVCGAWHSPVLQDLAQFAAKDDAALLKGLKKTTTAATWVAWSYQRLSSSAGYGAGVVSPAWYEILFHHKENATTQFLTRTAQLLRQQDLSASSAHIIDAVRLAQTTATLRGLAVAGIQELTDAAVTVLAEGETTLLALIEKQMVIGEKWGQVPEDIPTVPFQRDLEQLAKSLRIEKTLSPTLKSLDLRKEHDLKVSHFLHRLKLLNLNWGTEEEISDKVRGSFNEKWMIEWQPEFALTVIELATWGNTVLEATVQYVQHQLAQEEQLKILVEWLHDILNANLPELTDDLLSVIQTRATLTHDTVLLMHSLPSLIHILRYGNVRKTSTDIVKAVVYSLVPRIAIALPDLCTNIQDDDARELFSLITHNQQSINLLNEPDLMDFWRDALQKLTTNPTTNPLLSGAACRWLYNAGVFDAPTTSQQMSFFLSKGQKPADSAIWIEGFLHGSGLVLIHHHELWQLLHEWLTDLSEESFIENLPLLRRAFSQFSASERTKMLGLVKNENQAFDAKKELKMIYNMEAVEKITQSVHFFLGRGLNKTVVEEI